MPFSHNGLKTYTPVIQVFSQVNKYTLSYRFLYGNVQGCVFAKNRPVSLNWTDYTYVGSDLNTYLLLGGRGLMLWLFVGPTGVNLLDFFCSGIQFYLLLSPYLCFISLLYLDLYVLGDDALTS